MIKVKNPNISKCFSIIVFVLMLLSLSGFNEIAESSNCECNCGLGDIALETETYQEFLKPVQLDRAEELPGAYDARDDGIVTPAKDQGMCGSCWSFTSVGALESHLLDAGLTFSPTDLSDQQQVSCNLDMSGCCGGNSTALRYWENHGAIYESCFSYGESNTIGECDTSNPNYRTVPCADSSSCPQLDYRITNYHTVPKGDFRESVWIDGPSYFRYDFYSDFNTFWKNADAGEVYTQEEGYLEGGHAVLIIGWDDEKQAFLIKNSWGQTEGPEGDGTFWMAYDGHNNDLDFQMANFDVYLFEILTPNTDKQAFAGPAANPQKIIIHTNKPTIGLKKSDFIVTIGSQNANIITLYEGTDNYVFEILPAPVSANGIYDLIVEFVDGSVSISQEDSIVFSDTSNNIDVDLIIDRSGSMGGTPLTTAKAAASQFVDYMQHGDMVGVVSFESSARVDFTLTEIGDPGLINTIFSDDMESGTDKWIAESPWGRTMLRYSSPMHSWTDSPWGKYENNANASLRTAEEISIPSNAFSAVLRFDTRYDIEYDFDNGFVEVSTDDGINWTQVGGCITGTNTTWHTLEYDLSDYIGDGILLRFRLETDMTNTAQGWFIDDIVVGTMLNPDAKIDAKTAIDSLASGGGTNIGAGLQTGQNQLTSLGNENHPWSMVLLTDGNGAITNETISAIAESKTVVHTIGLGNGVDQNLLLNIATQTGGTYNYAPTPEQLSEIYNTISGTVSNRQTLLSTTGTVEENKIDRKTVVVDSTVSDAIFSLSWADSSSRINMVLVKPDGTIINPETAENNEYIDFVSGGTYQYYRVVSPALIPGVWEMEIQGGTITESEGKELRALENGINYAVQVTAVSSLTSRLFFDRDSYSLMEPIKLVMSISDSEPILGATVTVDVSAPSPTTAELIPMSEWIEINGDLVPDPDQLSELTTSDRAGSDSLALFDDGQHGDGLANDGVYANLFLRTYDPGTYKFSIKATGISTLGDQFERYGELSTYIEDDPTFDPSFIHLPLIIR